MQVSPNHSLARSVEFLIQNDFYSTPAPNCNKIVRYISWIPPLHPHIKLNIDGSARTNRGPGGIRGVFRNAHGEWLLGFRKSLGWTTNLNAELMALWQGLILAVECSYMQLEVETDSMVTIQLISNNCNKRYENIVLECRLLLGKLQWWQLKHTLREGNRVADSLATHGGDAVDGSLEVYTRPPSFASKTVLDDLQGQDSN